MTDMDISWIDQFIPQIKEYVFVREEDALLILIPNQAYKLNRSACRILSALLGGATTDQVLRTVGDTPDKRQDLHDFACDLRAVVSGCLREGEERRAVERVPFERPFNTLPVLSEVALTYRCNLQCVFCYAACGCRTSADSAEMSTAEAKRILHVIRRDAQVPSVSFTGGEPTLRRDLPKLIRHARSLDMRVNLITNGTTLTDRPVKRLVRSGLNSAQVSLEGPSPAVHDPLTGAPGSFDRTVAGIERLRDAGIRVHTNTTISRGNIEHLEGIVALAKDLGMERLSMNMVIPTGSSVQDPDAIWVTYTEIGDAVMRVKAEARRREIEFLWYSPTPFCLFNPAASGFGGKACAACDGLLSVSPTGDVLPCSSLAEPAGNLLREEFRDVWRSPRAEYYKSKSYAHEICQACEDFDVCCGACPLYWRAFGYDELKAVREEAHASIG
ncbi:MAG: radical SAM protein [Planctomycetes bacterium]|nr:radical SAM protein [Planctomycetota bacterium]